MSNSKKNSQNTKLRIDIDHVKLRLNKPINTKDLLYIKESIVEWVIAEKIDLDKVKVTTQVMHNILPYLQASN